MELTNEQAGFGPGRETRDLLVNIQILIEKVNATQNSVLFLMFVDYTKAFDMISHPKLFKVLLEMGIPKHLVALIQALYAQQTAKVRWDGESREAFIIGKGHDRGATYLPWNLTCCGRYHEENTRR